MLDVFAQIAAQAFPNQVVFDDQRPSSVKIRIPRDHPKLPEFLRLAEFFASFSRTDGGVEIERPAPVSPEVAERELLGLLAEIAGPTVVKQAVERLREETTVREYLTIQDCAAQAAEFLREID